MITNPGHPGIEVHVAHRGRLQVKFLAAGARGAERRRVQNQHRRGVRWRRRGVHQPRATEPQLPLCGWGEGRDSETGEAVMRCAANQEPTNESLLNYSNLRWSRSIDKKRRVLSCPPKHAFQRVFAKATDRSKNAEWVMF